jgi:hypothetical protein
MVMSDTLATSVFYFIAILSSVPLNVVVSNVVAPPFELNERVFHWMSRLERALYYKTF